ncbi:MAG: OmpA family protein [Halopseudomonas sp.]
MKTLKKHALAVALTGSLVAFPVLAAEPDHTSEHIGLGSGLVAGALVGGPVGAIVGGTIGLMVGHDSVQQIELEQEQAQLSQAQAQLDRSRDELAASRSALDSVNQQLTAKRDALQQAQQQWQELGSQYTALQELVGGLQLSVYFDHNSSAVKQQYHALIKSVSEGAAQVPGLTIDLKGHANKAGLDQYNLMLSEQRNERVGELLVTQGLAESNIRKQAQGAQQASPLRVYAPEERRVDLMFRFEQPAGLVSLH